MTLPKPYYQDDYATIYHGDCREILPHFANGYCVMAVTSPPYNLVKKWWDSGSNGMHVQYAKKFNENFYPDELPESEYQEQQKEIVRELIRICGGAVCYNHKVRYAFKRAGTYFHPMSWLAEFPLWVEIIWDKGSGVAMNCRRPTVSDERIFVLGRPEVFNNTQEMTVWKQAPQPEAGHPCAFPVEIPQRLIKMFSRPDDFVLDPFMGSGTTLVAAKNLGRKAIGIEIEEKYCAIAAKRLRQEVLGL